MSGPIYGADADELDRLAGEFDRAADQLDRDSGALSSLLNNISWLGDTAGRYLSDWTGFQMPKIGLSTRFLRDEASTLRSQANEQRHASEAGAVAATRAAPRVGPQTPKQQLDDRFAEKRERLRDFMATLDPQGSLYNALENALERGYEVYGFDPANGYLTWSSGNLATATNVVVTVPGTTTTMESLTTGMGQVNGRYLDSDTATLSTLTWKPPPTVPHNIALDMYERTLVAGPLGSYLEHLDGMGKNIVVTGHSAGAAAVQTLFERRPDLIQHVDGVALLAPAEIHGEFPLIMGDKPVLYAVHRDDPINIVHIDPSDAFGRVVGGFDSNTDIVYRDSGRSTLDRMQVWKGDAHQEWRYAENYHDEVVGMFPGPQDLGNGVERQQYTDEHGVTRYADVPQF